MSRFKEWRALPRQGDQVWALASVLAMVMGAAMRWYGLARFPFEQDELYTLQESRELFATSLRPGIDARPLYYLLHHLLTPVLPAGEFGARLPAYCFGLLGMIVTWRLGRYLAGRAGGFLALALCAFSPWHLFVSGEARYWSLVYLLATSAVLMLLKGREADRWGTHAAAGLLLALGALAHPTFLFPLVGISMALLIDPTEQGVTWRWPSRKALFGTWIPAGMVIGGHLLILTFTGRGSALSNWSGRGMLATLRLLPAMVQLATTTLVAAGAAGITSSLLWGTIRAKRFALMAVGGLVTGSGLLLMASTRTDVYADYGVSMLPLGIAAAACMLLLSGPTRTGPLAGALALVLVTATLPETASQLSDGMRYDYRPAFARIRDLSDGRPALVWPAIIQQYYAPELPAVEFKRTVAQLDSVSTGFSAFWVLASKNRQGLVGDSGGSVAAWLKSHCDETMSYARERFDYREYRVVLFSCEQRATGTK